MVISKKNLVGMIVADGLENARAIGRVIGNDLFETKINMLITAERIKAVNKVPFPLTKPQV